MTCKARYDEATYERHKMLLIADEKAAFGLVSGRLVVSHLLVLVFNIRHVVQRRYSLKVMVDYQGFRKPWCCNSVLSPVENRIES